MVKHGGGGVVIWCCFAALGPGQLNIIKATQDNVGQSVCNLKSEQIWLLTHDGVA